MSNNVPTPADRMVSHVLVGLAVGLVVGSKTGDYRAPRGRPARCGCSRHARRPACSGDCCAVLIPLLGGVLPGTMPGRWLPDARWCRANGRGWVLGISQLEKGA